MRLTVILLTAAFLQVQAAGLAQNVTLSGTSLTLKEVFTAVKKQTGYVFLCPENIIQSASPVSVSAEDVPLEEFLRTFFESHPLLQYKIKGKSIFISGRSDHEPLPFVVSLADPIRIMVLDADGRPLAGASVINTKNKLSGITDADGVLRLSASEGNKIDITFVGYTSQQVTVSAEQIASGNIVITLVKAESRLDEVVVSTGYWSTTKRKSTGNIFKVTSKDIEGQPVTSPLMALQGRVPGLQLSLKSGAPNTAPVVRIRGNNSIRAQGSNPLFVIDGVVVESKPLNSMSALYSNSMDPLAGINPENIESIEVLKDADATSIYGSRGANGVILIKTKQQKGDGPTAIEVSGYHGVGKIPHFIDMLNTEQYLEMRREGLKHANMEPDNYDFDLKNWDQKKYTNWQKELLSGSTKISDLELVFSGGNERTSFRLNGGYHKETNFISDEFGFDRKSIGISTNHRSKDNRLNVSSVVNYGSNKNSILDITPFIVTALDLPPNAPDLRNEDGSLNWGLIYLPDQNYTTNSIDNPWAKLLRTDESKAGTLVANVNLSYLLLKGLTIRANMGFTDMNGSAITKEPILASAPNNIYAGSTGTAYFGTNKRNSWIVEPQASYDLIRNGHELNLMAGVTFQQSMNLWQGIMGRGYQADGLLGTLQGAPEHYIIYDNESEYRYTAAYARIGYNWKEKYLLNLTGRRDGSSRFGPGKQFGNFGSVAAAWIFSSEPFMNTTSNILSTGKLRGSYGTTGNDQIGEYAFYDMYTFAGTYANWVTMIPKALFNPNFQWEVTKKAELSLELGLLKDRIFTQATWYRHVSGNQIVEYPMPSTTGFTSLQRNFTEATIENTGWEFVVDGRQIDRKNFGWSTAFNITIQNNKLLSFTGIETSPYANRYKVGSPLSILKNYIWQGVDPQTGRHMIADIDGNGVINFQDQVFNEDLDQKFNGGILNSFRYKQLRLSFLFEFTKANNFGYYVGMPGQRQNQPVQVMDRWQKPGDISNMSRYSVDWEYGDSFSQAMSSDYGIVDASYIRLRTLSLSYIFPTRLLKNVGIKEAKIYAHAQNLFTITNYIGLAPDMGGGAKTLPPLRMITGGINIKL